MNLTFQSYIEFGSFILSLYLGYSGVKWWKAVPFFCATKALFTLITFNEELRNTIFSGSFLIFALLGWFIQGAIGWYFGNYLYESYHKASEFKGRSIFKQRK